MFNNSLFDKEAKLKMAEREREAEMYRWHQQLGYSDRGALRWVFGFITLIAMLVIVLILL
jgi:hypothetical protein